MDGTVTIAIIILILFAVIMAVYFASYVIGILLASLHPQKRPGHDLHEELALLTQRRDQHHQHTQLSNRQISSALHHLALNHPYVVFDHFALNAVSGYPQTTYVDHLVISQTGIFCIETKPHKGSIQHHITHGNEAAERWEHHHDGRRDILDDPLAPAKAYQSAFKQLLGPYLRSPIHYFLVFPRAHVVTSPHVTVTNNIDDVIYTIERHQKPMYTAEQFEYLLKLFVYASHPDTKLSDTHRRELARQLHPTTTSIRRH